VEDLIRKCVRCGSCKALCPTYIADLTEGMGPRGRVSLLNDYIDGSVNLSKKLDYRLFSCMLCGACNTLCPLGINITDVMYDIRIRLKNFDTKRRILAYLARFSLKNPYRLFKILRLIDEIGDIFPSLRKKILRDFDFKIPFRILRDEAYIYKAERTRGRVAIFAGCTVNVLYPNIGKSLIYSLNRLGYDAVLPKGEVCCGAPLMAIGLKEDATDLAFKNLKIFKSLNVEAIIGLCPTCIHFIKNEYKKIAGESLDNALDVSQFFIETNISEMIKKNYLFKKSVAYHDPCHSLYGLKIRSEPRRILSSFGIVPFNKQSGCCGFGGTFRLLYKDISEAIVRDRIEDYKRAEVIITSCPNCVIQLKNVLKDKMVLHMAEVLDSSLN
jgi:glycolate oxidase iron-sulfur subunit